MQLINSDPINKLSEFNVFAAELKKNLEFLKQMLVLIKETFILCRITKVFIVKN